MPEKFLKNIPRKRIVTPAGIELTLEAEKHINIKKKDRILSIGCGTGEIESYLAIKYGIDITGIDIDENAINIAKGYNSRNLNFEVGDGENLRFPEKSFDYVFSMGALGGFFDKGIREAYRVLKQHGRIILIEVIFMGDRVPKDMWNIWANRKIKVLNRDSMIYEFERIGFSGVFDRIYYEPAWWDVYYATRGKSPGWEIEKMNYHKYSEFIGIGLFIFEKSF